MSDFALGYRGDTSISVDSFVVVKSASLAARGKSRIFALVIRREGEERARIEHIPFLGRRMKAIERMLSEQRVTTYEHR